MTEWTFLTNHALVLDLITKNQRVTAADLARAIGVTERTVIRIVAELARRGCISKEREGRKVRYHVNPDLPHAKRLYTPTQGGR